MYTWYIELYLNLEGHFIGTLGNNRYTELDVHLGYFHLYTRFTEVYT